MAILNPITNAAVLALDPATRGEERLQSLLHLWLKTYFGGSAFTTLKADGTTESKTFTKCTYAYQEDKLPDNPQVPQIHLVMPDRRTKRENYKANELGHDDDWTIDVMAKVPVGLANTEMPGISAEEIARRLGSELEWLFDSTEREALSIHGVTKIRLERPSTLVPAAAWQMRMLVVSCRTRREQARRSF